MTVQDFGQIQTPGGTVSVRLAPGSGCEPVLDSLGQQVIGYVRCPLPAGGSLPRLLAYLGDGGDTLVADAQLRAEVYGGNAFDTLTANGRVYGGAGSDSIRPVNTTDPQRRYGGLGDDFISGGAGPDTISGGPGPDWIDAGRGADKITGGPGEDEVWLHGQGLRSRDIVRLRDHETDELHCAAGSPADRLLLDGIDWTVIERRRPCQRVFRSSPAVALPVYLWSPLWGEWSATGVDVHCPWDGPAVCEGTITVRIAGRRFGPKPFRVRAGTEEGFAVARQTFAGEEEGAPGTVTLRGRLSLGHTSRKEGK